MTTAYQTLGDVDELIARDHHAFAYPEHAVITPLLSDGTTERNYVLQSSGLSVREARRSWVAVTTADKDTIAGYAEDKTEVAYTEEDETTRNVRVMDFTANQRYVGYWDITVRLIETEDPAVAGS